MKKITILCTAGIVGTVKIEGESFSAIVPVGLELAMDDTLADVCIAQHTCIVGYYVANDTAVATLPTTGIADGSYCMVMNTQTLKFLTAGAWV